MTEFAPYTAHILGAYGIALLVIFWLVMLTWLAAFRIRHSRTRHDDLTD
ncbi:MAG: hypothetical protein OXC91_03205 [Rhodobacteraceae bacterium]|nr:hypothetical protein [Paracoccaceae bacterium]